MPIWSSRRCISRWMIRASLLVIIYLILRPACSLSQFKLSFSKGLSPSPTSIHSYEDIEDIFSRLFYPVLDDTLAAAIQSLRLPVSPVRSESLGTTPRHSSVNAPHELCDYVRGKTLYFVGPTHTTYQLHNYMARNLQPRGGRQPHCLGPMLCSYHIFCQSSNASTLPLKFPGHPRSSDIIGTDASLLRFIPSTTLYASSNKDDPVYNLLQADTQTGVRVLDDPWVTAAAAASVLILGRAPIPAPASSYTPQKGSSATWDWLDIIARVEQTTTREETSATFKHILKRITGGSSAGSSRHEYILRAALYSTVSTFIPSVLSTLSDLQTHRGFAPILGEKIVVWHGNWFLHLNTTAGKQYGRETQDLFGEHLSRAVEPWSGYYNAQVLAHDYILPRILAAYGISYVPLSSASDRGQSRDRDSSYGRVFVDALLDVLQGNSPP